MVVLVEVVCSSHRPQPSLAKSTQTDTSCFHLLFVFSWSLFQQFDEANRPRVLRRNFLRLRAGVELRIWNRGAKQKANAVAALSIRRRMFRKLRAATASAVASRLCKTRADAFANRTLTVMGWEVLREHPAENKVCVLSGVDSCREWSVGTARRYRQCAHNETQ